MKKLIRFFCVMAFIALTTNAATQQRSTALLGKSAVNYMITNGAITITESSLSETGVSGEVIIPATINGLPVTTIGESAFQNSRLASVVIPDSVTTIESFAFYNCDLTSITIPDGVTSLGGSVFSGCAILTNVKIGKGLTNISDHAFAYCTSLTNIIIPDSVTQIDNRAFEGCSSLTSITFGKGLDYIHWANFGGAPLKSVYFMGNAPGVIPYLKLTDATVYYLPGATGWGTELSGAPTKIWELPLAENSIRVTAPGDLKFSWPSGQVVVEASTDLVRWTPLATLAADFSNFKDPDRANYPVRFYRLRSP